MERRFDSSRDFAEMFGGVQPSRQAVDLAKRAIFLGEDPTALTQQAGIAARRDGRSKVGFFGGAQRPLDTLRSVVQSIEGRRSMQESSRRANRK